MDPKKKKLIILFSILTTVLLLIVGIVIVLVLKSNTSENKEVEIVYWGFWEEDEVMHPLVEKYEAENPGIKIKYSLQPSINYESKTYTRLQQADTSDEPAPDIIMIHNTWLPKYEKYLSSLPNSVMDKDTFSQEFYPSAVDDLTGRDDEIYAIPLQIDGLMVIYNKDLLSKVGYSTPPRDWDSFIALAQKLTKKDSLGKITQSGLAIGTAKNITHVTDILSYFLLQNGVVVMNSTRDQMNITSSRAISAFNTYTSFVQDESATWATYLPNDLVAFEKGQLAMMFGTTWRAFDILEDSPDINFGLAPLPYLPTNKEVYYSSYWAEAVTKSSENQLEAWKFIKFLSEPEQLRRLFQNAAKIRPFGQPYSRVSMNTELQQNTYTKAIASMAPYMKSIQTGEQSFVQDLLKQAITDAVERNVDGTSLLRNVEEEINLQLAVSNK